MNYIINFIWNSASWQPSQEVVGMSAASVGGDWVLWIPRWENYSGAWICIAVQVADLNMNIKYYVTIDL